MEGWNVDESRQCDGLSRYTGVVHRSLPAFSCPPLFPSPPFTSLLCFSSLIFLCFFPLPLGHGSPPAQHSSETLAPADTLNPKVCERMCAKPIKVSSTTNRERDCLQTAHTHCAVTPLMHVSCRNPERFDICLSLLMTNGND